MNSTKLVSDAWNTVSSHLGLQGDLDATWQFLCTHYTETWRAYHNLDHIADCLRICDSVVPAPTPALNLAILFHDLIYVMGAADNETRSADEAVTCLARHSAPQKLCEDVRALIEATDHKRPPASEEARLLCDIDLSILGRDQATYVAYAEAILKETGMTPEAFAPPRAAFLEAMLGKPWIFHTETFRQDVEPTARRNMQRELTHLRKQ